MPHARARMLPMIVRQSSGHFNRKPGTGVGSGDLDKGAPFGTADFGQKDLNREIPERREIEQKKTKSTKPENRKFQTQTHFHEWAGE